MERSLWSDFYLVSLRPACWVMEKSCTVTSYCLKKYSDKGTKARHALCTTCIFINGYRKYSSSQIYCQLILLTLLSKIQHWQTTCTDKFTKLLPWQKSHHVIQYKTNVFIQYNLDYLFEDNSVKPLRLIQNTTSLDGSTHMIL